MSKLLKDDLNDLNFSKFLDSGFIAQNPADSKIYLGIHANEVGSEFGCFKASFYQNHFDKKYSDEVFVTDVNTLYLWIEDNFSDKTLITKVEDTDQNFKEDVANCLSWIESSEELTKIVSVTSAHYKYITKVHPISCLKRLCENLNGHLYGEWSGGEGVLGVSPEPLYFENNNKLYTMALAGTISTKIDKYENLLLNDPKERDEHQYVIEDIKEKLTSLTENISVHDTEIYNFGPFAHLRTLIEFSFKGDNQALIKGLAPTAALGGYPSLLSMEYLKKTHYYQYEKQERYFGGVYGFHYPGVSFSLVGIRNIYWNQNDLTIHSGSGIVSGSSVEKECAEVIRKRKSIEDIFTHE